MDSLFEHFEIISQRPFDLEAVPSGFSVTQKLNEGILNM